MEGELSIKENPPETARESYCMIFCFQILLSNEKRKLILVDITHIDFVCIPIFPISELRDLM